MNGNFLTKWGSRGTEDGQFETPVAIATDSFGSIYVVDRDNNRIQKFDSDGNFLTKWGSFGTEDGQFRSSEGIDTDASGNVYVVDRDNNRVQKFDSDGNFLTKWGSLGTEDGQFAGPKGIATNSSGNVYVLDGTNRIQRFIESFGLVVSKTGSGSGTVTSTPAGINCGSECSESYNHGSSVTMSASADAGSNFSGWSGACSGTGTCQVTMDQARSVTASFSLNDSDSDGIPNSSDNCPDTSNPGQADADGDGIGDACDSDRDGDGVPNGTDNCSDVSNPGQADADNDGLGDACDPEFGSSTCVKSGTELAIHIAAGDTVSAGRSGSSFKVTGRDIEDPNCGGATVNNIDSVNVTGTVQNETLRLDLSEGQFARGATIESAGTSEIEFTVNLSAGSDAVVIDGGKGAEKITFLSAGVKVNGDQDTDLTHSGVEAMTANGNRGNDKLTGGPSDEILAGGDGKDTIQGAAGADSLSGGSDVDTVLYTGSTSAVTVDLGNASDTDQSASGGFAMGDTIAGFENATGSSFGDALIGSIAANILKGALGNDTLYGYAGNDKLFGGRGTDSFHGGTGTDDCDAVAGETAVSCER